MLTVIGAFAAILTAVAFPPCSNKNAWVKLALKSAMVEERRAVEYGTR